MYHWKRLWRPESCLQQSSCAHGETKTCTQVHCQVGKLRAGRDGQNQGDQDL